MPKNKSIHGITVLFTCSILCTLLWSCASDDKVDTGWASTDDIYSAASITSSKATISANGDVVIVWQEQETQVRDDLEKDLAHTFPGTVAALDSHANIHKHKLLFSRTSIKTKRYDASAESWSSDKLLQLGYWEKSKSGIVDVDDEADESKIIYEENIDNTFIGSSAVAMNRQGDAAVAWIQLDESDIAEKAGDANTDHILFASLYTAASDSWSAPHAVSTAITINNSSTQDIGLTSASVTANASASGNVTVKNNLSMSLNDNKVAQLVWLGRAAKSDFDISSITHNAVVNNSAEVYTEDDLALAKSAGYDVIETAFNAEVTNKINDKVNAYQSTFDGSTSSSVTMISDGSSSVSDIKLIQRNQTSGVAVWMQNNALAQGATQTQKGLYSNWYNSVGWNATAVLINNGIGEVQDFSVVSNSGEQIWSSWSQTNLAYPSLSDTLSTAYDVDQISTIWVNDFVGDIDTDITSGDWASNAAVNIQSSAETTLASHDTAIAMDSSGNMVVVWEEKRIADVNPTDRKDAIVRANVYLSATASWLTESFIVSNTDYFAANQPIEKTIPNDHIAPSVVSTGINKFTISWQYRNVSREQSGYQLVSIDYDASTKTSSAVSIVSETFSPVVNQMDMLAIDEDVQIIWSQASNSGVRLKQSVK